MSHFILKAVAVSLVCGLNAFADLPTSFLALSNQSKGPFGLNVLQGTTQRAPVREGRTPGGYLFQAAYRNDVARALITDYSFYTGNLFTTNYYELMGEYVYGNPDGSHVLDHAGLVAKSTAVIGKASLIVQHWVLEKHYIEQFPDAKLSRSYKLRGISDFANEAEYARYFLNFYLGAIDGDFQYLPAYLLATRSPIVESASLARARDLVAHAYGRVSAGLGTTHAMARELYKLRNSIHNQLTPAVIAELDRFLKKYPNYGSVVAPPAPVETIPGPVVLPVVVNTEVVLANELGEVRTVLVAYYSFSAATLSKLAAKVGLADVKAAADQIVKQGATTEGLYYLSIVASAKREQLAQGGSVPYEKRAEVLALLTNVSRYLKKELSVLKTVNSPKVAEAALNTIYIEGFLIRDNWKYFQAEVAKSTNLSKTLTDIVNIASDNALKEAFTPALSQWMQIDPKMQYFYDNTIKSSAIDTAAKIIQKLPQ